MAREIKFRGKKHTGEWLYGDLVHLTDNKIFIYPLDCEGLFLQNEVDTNTIGQFIGLYDKNGREIYEGDILRMFANINKISDPMLSNTEPKYRLTTVVYDDAAFKVTSDGKPDAVINYYCGAMVKDMEVIGNIHDNPELLKTETL